MSLKTDLIDLIKAARQKFSNPAPAEPTEPAPAQFTKYQLEDGTEIEVDKLEAGGKVMVNGMPAPEGSMKLADGSEIMCDANGMITEVKPAAAPPAEDEMSKFKTDFATLSQEFGNFKTLFARVQTEFSEAKQTIEKQQEAITGLFEIVEKLSQAPVAQPVAPTPSAFKTQETKETLMDKAAEIAANFKASAKKKEN